MFSQDDAELYGKLTFEIHKRFKQFLLRDVHLPIDIPHILLLGFLKVNGVSTVSEISYYLDITLSGVTSLIKKLVDLDLVERKRNEKDRRIVFIFLTTKSKRTMNIIKNNRNEFFKKFFEDISKEDLIVYKSVINQAHNKILNDSFFKKSIKKNKEVK